MEVCDFVIRLKDRGGSHCYRQSLRKIQGSAMQRSAHLQIAVNTQSAQFHDEFKLQLPAILTPHHHLLFTFFTCRSSNEVGGTKAGCDGLLSSPSLDGCTVSSLRV